MRPAPEEANFEAVSRRRDDTRASAHGTGSTNHHVLPEHHAWLRKALEQTIDWYKNFLEQRPCAAFNLSADLAAKSA